MSTRTTQSHPPGDRLERLLSSGGEVTTAGGHGGQGDASGEWDRLERSSGTRDGGELGTDDLEQPVAGGRHRAVRVPLLSVPESLRSAELHVGVRAVRGLLVLVVVAVLVLGGRWLWTQRAAVATPTDRVVTGQTEGETEAGGGAEGEQGEGGTAGSQAGPAGEGGPVQGAAAQEDGGARDGGDEEPGRAASDQAGSSADLVVHVAGAVVEPGVVRVPAGSRVVDAVRAAGGTTDEADQSTLNLARPLVDGERVWVGRPGETPPVAPGPVPGATGATGGGGDTGAGGQPTPLDLNAATQADLEELPGVGPVTAGHILSWREEHGRFSSVDELLEVSGIGERTLARLEPLVTVGG